MSQTTAKETERNLSSFVVAGGVVVGLIFPDVAEALYPHIFTALFFIVAFSLNTIEERPTSLIRRFDPFTRVVVFWQMLVVPACTMALCIFFEAPTLITTVLLATTTAGSVFASPALVRMVGLDRSVAVSAMIVSTLAMPISLLSFGELSGVLPLDIRFDHYFQQIFYYLVTPLALAFLYWEFRPTLGVGTQQVIERAMNWGSTVAVVVFCIGVMSKIHGSSPEHIGNLVTYAVIAGVLSLSMYVLTGIFFYSYGRRLALTAAMLAANRNVALSFALLNDVFPREIMTYVAVAQFPIFLAPVLILLVQYLGGLIRQRALGDGSRARRSFRILR